MLEFTNEYWWVIGPVVVALGVILKGFVSVYGPKKKEEPNE